MSPSPPTPTESETLTAALRGVRQRRNLKTAQVAARMGLKLRTYQHFEAGRSQLDWERIKAFAQATDSDAHAILTAVMIGSPDFALRCLDNKLMSVLVVAVGRLDQRMGDNLSRLEVGRLIAAFRKLFDELEGDLSTRDEQARRWLDGSEP